MKSALARSSSPRSCCSRPRPKRNAARQRVRGSSAGRSRPARVRPGLREQSWIVGGQLAAPVGRDVSSSAQRRSVSSRAARRWRGSSTATPRSGSAAVSLRRGRDRVASIRMTCDTETGYNLFLGVSHRGTAGRRPRGFIEFRWTVRGRGTQPFRLVLGFLLSGCDKETSHDDQQRHGRLGRRTSRRQGPVQRASPARSRAATRSRPGSRAPRAPIPRS